ncbi:MAG: aldo/keto reductase [Bacteroidales bacterium]|nr:aldo/keto reductase [Bacteroidales bacterium]
MVSIESNQIPKKRLYTGDEIPIIGLGTFGSDKYSEEVVSEAVYNAALAGYRHFDCAAVYGNESQIGEVLKRIMDTGIKRKELWITSKLWNDKHAEEDVIPAFMKSLYDLQLDYLDLYLVHWPFPNFHAKGCDITSRNPNSRPYIHENFMKVWRQLEKLVDKGLVKNIGTSNVTIPKLELMLKDMRIKPSVNEMELHPHLQQQELFDYCIKKDIQPIAYCPLGSPSRPERDRTENDTVDMEDPTIIEIANKLNVHPAYVCIKWAIQRGQIPIPFSVKEHQYISNLKAAISEPLQDEDMKAISKINKNCRLVKGHVFLWKENQTWEDLWDINGEIPC